MTWAIEVYLRPELYDPEKERVRETAAELHIATPAVTRYCRLYILEGAAGEETVAHVARVLLTDPVAEQFELYRLDGTRKKEASGDVAYVLFHPGVMDTVAQTCEAALSILDIEPHRVRTGRVYYFAEPVPASAREAVAYRVLANPAIEKVYWDRIDVSVFRAAPEYRFELVHVPLRAMDDEELMRVSREGLLSLTMEEMRALRDHYHALGRDPTDVELETFAQTWSEHCSHKTLKGPVHYVERNGRGQTVREINFRSLLKETIFAATETVRRLRGDHDICVRVFTDNAGIIRFTPEYHCCFKVETHNHPSAIEPYGGASTGLGGVIRDIMGCGLGAKPIAGTDVFCVGPLDYPPEQLPEGVLHPRRVLKGVVAGVRDYGNRMGIPTVSGAVLSEPEYLANPLVYCGCIGLMPAGAENKAPRSGDCIVVVGGRTGRDGIHGATFSSAALHDESAEVSGGAVQIGNPITQKRMLDALLLALEERLYTCITDCGAGGLSSAIGEMAADLGAEVWLERVPLKYSGLSYREIWISESQERMVIAIPEANWPKFHAICQQHGVEATVIGRFCGTGRLRLYYNNHQVADIDLRFLHKGCPVRTRRAEFRLAEPKELAPDGIEQYAQDQGKLAELLDRVLSDYNVCSKEWIIRQYDHEVQGATTVKPLVGVRQDGPSDAAVLFPILTPGRGLAVSCAINPRYGRLDPYWMAACAVDEAVRNCVAVGGDPNHIALLDNFCWGNTERPEQLGTLVRAALGCRDAAEAFLAPFISGKDSLHNEYRGKLNGQEIHLTVPPSLLISAVAVVPELNRCTTMDLKKPGHILVLVGETRVELGGSAFAAALGWHGGQVPRVDFQMAPRIMQAISEAIGRGYVAACHDVSEGGVLAAVAEMAVAGRLGAELWVPDNPFSDGADLTRAASAISWLFSETPSRFVLELAPEHLDSLAALLPRPELLQVVGRVVPPPRLLVQASSQGPILLEADVEQLREQWQRPMRW